MNSLSVVIITFNEEKNIARCMHSARAVADEIIVMDSFSTDGTEAIVRGSGGSFYQHVFSGYGDQKNAAVSFAAHDHIRFRDADAFRSEDIRDSIPVEKGN